jgi:hypothetical protein
VTSACRHDDQWLSARRPAGAPVAGTKATSATTFAPAAGASASTGSAPPLCRRCSSAITDEKTEIRDENAQRRQALVLLKEIPVKGAGNRVLGGESSRAQPSTTVPTEGVNYKYLYTPIDGSTGDQELVPVRC